jgi:ribosome-associated protein
MIYSLNGAEYIELNKLLKLLKLVESGGMAKMVIGDELVWVNKAIETQIRKKLRIGDIVNFENVQIEIIA